MSKGIYCYTDKKNDRIVYIGKDSNIHGDTRCKAHFSPSKYDAQPFNRILQNNPDRYEYRVLAELSDDFSDNDLNNLEEYFIEKLNTYNYEHPDGFNFTRGGDGTSGFKPSEETKRKLSENHARYWKDKSLSDEHKKKISEKLTGRKHPEETKRKISKTKNTTGFYRVSIQNDSSYKKGFRWKYRYKVNSQRKSITSTDLNKLKDKVLEQGLEWYIINEENALKSLKKDKKGVKK